MPSANGIYTKSRLFFKDIHLFSEESSGRATGTAYSLEFTGTDSGGGGVQTGDCGELTGRVGATAAAAEKLRGATATSESSSSQFLVAELVCETSWKPLPS